MNPVKKIGFDENSTPPKNMIGYRGEGKFYEGKNNDGVLCYNLVDVATQEQMGQNNYVIAQALNDLNERVGGLQSQVAQQDYIIVNLIDVLDDSLDAFSKEITRQLANYIEAGVIFDVILQDPNGYRSRICAHSQVNDSGEFSIVAWATTELKMQRYSLSLQ